MSHQLVTDQPIQHITITDTQPNPLTWIIYQGHISTRCPTSPTHASTKHVPRSPTYHHYICVQTCTKAYTKPSTSTIKGINHVLQLVSQQVHQPCRNTCSKPCINHALQLVPNHASTMHLNLCHMPQPSTMYSKY
jgi:hypothetical protein